QYADRITTDLISNSQLAIDTELKPQAWVNIINDVIAGLPGVDRLLNESISASIEKYYYGKGIEYPYYESVVNQGAEYERGTLSGAFNTETNPKYVPKGIIKVTMFFDIDGSPRSSEYVKTASNIQNIVHAHEIWGHGVLDIGGDNADHRI